MLVAKRWFWSVAHYSNFAGDGLAMHVPRSVQLLWPMVSPQCFLLVPLLEPQNVGSFPHECHPLSWAPHLWPIPEVKSLRNRQTLTRPHPTDFGRKCAENEVRSAASWSFWSMDQSRVGAHWSDLDVPRELIESPWWSSVAAECGARCWKQSVESALRNTNKLPLPHKDLQKWKSNKFENQVNLRKNTLLGSIFKFLGM